MASIDAYDAIHDHIVASWSGPTILFENEGGQRPKDGSTLIVAEIFGSVLSQDTIGAPGNNRWTEDGQIYLHILQRRNTGSRDARITATNLSNLFREQTPDARLSFGDMSIGAGEPAEEDGNYWRLTLTIDWFWTDDTSA